MTGTGSITTIAGQRSAGAFSGDGGPATAARLNFEQNLTGAFVLAFDPGGNLHVADSGNNRVRRISKDGTITTVAGSGGFGFFGDGGPATQASFNYPASVAVDAQSNLYVADLRNQRIRRVTSAGTISTFAGGGRSRPDSLSLIPVNSATELALNNIFHIVFDNRGYLVTDQGFSISPTGKPVPQCCLGVFDSQGNNYYASSEYLISRNGTPFAGTGISGNFGDGLSPLAAQFGYIGALALDPAGNLYIADNQYCVIRRISKDGTVSTVVGRPQFPTASSSSSGDGGPAGSANIGIVYGMVFDASGNLYFAEKRTWASPGSDESNLIRKVARSGEAGATGSIPTISSPGVVNAATFASAVNSGSWATIFGENFAPIAQPGRTWRTEEIVGGLLPTTLEGVTVRFDGKPSPIYFVGPTQLNVLVPDDVRIGIVPVEVETRSGVARTNADVRGLRPKPLCHRKAWAEFPRCRRFSRWHGHRAPIGITRIASSSPW